MKVRRKSKVEKTTKGKASNPYPQKKIIVNHLIIKLASATPPIPWLSKISINQIMTHTLSQKRSKMTRTRLSLVQKVYHTIPSDYKKRLLCMPMSMTTVSHNNVNN